MMANGGMTKNQYIDLLTTYYKLHNYELDKAKKLAEYEVQNSQFKKLSDNTLMQTIPNSQGKIEKRIYEIRGNKIFLKSRSYKYYNDKLMDDGGMMAKGGLVEHGLRTGDKIIGGKIIGTTIRVRNENFDEDARIDLETGKRTKLVYDKKTKKYIESKAMGGKMNDEEGINLFEDYENIPPKVQKILDKYEDAFMDGDYEGLLKAHKELGKIGYEFEYYLDGVAYDLRPIGTKGKVESMDEFAMGGKTFDDKVQSISKSLLERKKVAPSVQKDYGKTYNKQEALDSARRIVGSMVKKSKN